MRSAAPLVVVALVAMTPPALADTFGGFSGVDRPYLVNQDRICTPLKVTGGSATGAPACEKAGADVVAKLSIKDPISQRGAKAAFAATATGRTLTVTRKTGDKLLTWEAPDSIVKVIDVYASQYEDRIAVAIAVRRMGKETTAVVAFDLGQGQTGIHKDPTPATQPGPPVTQPGPPVPVEAPKVAKAVADARKAPKTKVIAAWKSVLVIDATHTEAMYRIAAAHAIGKQAADAIGQLATLSASSRPDAIEWLIEARFDPSFAALRADPKFRAAVGLDRKPTTAYERLMGFGGQWEQTGTSCDKPEVRLNIARDRTFKLRVKTTCSGQVFDTPFKGAWRVDASGIILMLPNKGKVTDADEAPCVFEPSGDEDALRCQLDKDLEFVVLPTRR
ncbi:MAG: hypothetical protein H6Q90_3702 [Deltaproteobacteria bacterium]|nr:hypothetical protein [Deltaproteobacteria bacterium]